MEKCDCYHTRTERHYLTEFERGLYLGRTGKTAPDYEEREVPECWGTKEKDVCNCGGDKSKCDFYAKVREEAEKEANK